MAAAGRPVLAARARLGRAVRARPQRVGGRDGWLLWARYTGTADSPGWLLMGQGLLPQMCVVADADLGVLLRMTSYADGTPVMCTELFNFTVPPPSADQELFTLSRPDGVPVIHGETALDELNIPAPLRAAFGAVSRAWRRGRQPGQREVPAEQVDRLVERR